MNEEPLNGQPLPKPEPTPFVVLDDVFVPAYLGPSISMHGPPRAVYSLPLLEEVVKAHSKVGAQQARREVTAIVHDVSNRFGDTGPIFLDDREVRKQQEEASRIIRPGGWRPPRR